MDNTKLYIAEMENPWTIRGRRILLSRPELPWEIEGFGVNEGPAILQRNGRVFLTYSASATDDRYCMGLLTADAGSDLLDAKSWTKSPRPVFSSCEIGGQYGPGHNGFTQSDDGRHDLLVYHARPYREIAGNSLYDPNRHARVQRIGWAENGAPHFGVPVPDGLHDLG